MRLTTVPLVLALAAGCHHHTTQPPLDVDSLFDAAELNPTGNTPLAAEVPFHPAGDMAVTVAVADLDAAEPPLTVDLSVSGAATVVRLPVLGLFPAHDNVVTFTVSDATGTVLGTHEVTITTDAAPADLPTVTATGDHDVGQLTFVEWLRTPMSRAEGLGFMLDRRGRVRWYSSFPIPALQPMEMIAGTLWAGDSGTLLLHYDLLGHELARVDLQPLGYERIHHDIFQRDDGNVLLTVDYTGSPYIEDRVIQVDPTAGSLRARWNLADTFPDVAGLFYDVPMTGPSEPGVTNDPVHNNAVWYDESDDTLIACSQRSGVAKLYKSGQLKWFLAPQLIRWIDDANGDGVSDSLAANYDPNNHLTWLSDFHGPNFTDERYPVNGKPTYMYSSFEFNYGEFMLTPLDSTGAPITDSDVLLGFTDHPDFAWPFRPHAARLAANGNLLVFDNGLGRNFGFPFTPDSYSRAVEYEIVPDTSDGYGGTVRQVWEYRLTADPSWYAMSPVVGSVVDLPGGTRLVDSGALGSSFMQGTVFGTYDGPIGALIVEIDPRDNSELHRLSLERVVDADHPATEFSAYRATRLDPYAYWRDRPLGQP